jgi:hypothetical protein
MVVCFTTAVQLSFYSILRFSDWVSFQLLEFQKDSEATNVCFGHEWCRQQARNSEQVHGVLCCPFLQETSWYTLFTHLAQLFMPVTLRLQHLNLVKKILLNAELISGFWPHSYFVVILYDVSIVSEDQY